MSAATKYIRNIKPKLCPHTINVCNKAQSKGIVNIMLDVLMHDISFAQHSLTLAYMRTLIINLYKWPF